MVEWTLPFRDLAGLGDEERTRLSARLSPLRSLEDVLNAGRLWRPQLTLADVVVQDEYTHDVVLCAGGDTSTERFLVFDTT